MAYTGTKKANLKNPEVLRELLEADLEMLHIQAKLRFAGISTIDNTLVGQPGDRINVVGYNYLGAAVDVAEAEEITIEKLQSTEKISPVIKKIGKGSSITDEALLTAYGDPVGETKKQIELAIKDKLDADIMKELGTAPLTHDNSSAIIGFDAIMEATGKFCDEEEENYVLFLHPNQKNDIVKDPNFEKASQILGGILTEGAIGRIAGCDIILSRRVPVAKVGESGSEVDVFTNFIVKEKPVKILTKRGVLVETDRNIKGSYNEVVATAHYVCWLEFADKVVKMTNKRGYSADVPAHWEAENVTPRP